MAGIFGYVPNNTLGALYLTPQTGNEARWRQALANQGSISKTRPSLSGRLENLTVDTLRKAGVSDRTAARLGSKTFSAVNDLTPVGNLTGADEGVAQFGRGLTRGDLGQAALGAGIFGLSVFPGAAGRVVGKVGKGMFGRLLKDESGAIRAWNGSTEPFQRWFDGSKAVGPDGAPLTVYHGTTRDFDAFDPGKIGANWGKDKDGYFFTTENYHSISPIDGTLDANYGATEYARGDGGNIMPVYLALKNPYTVDHWARDINAPVDELLSEVQDQGGIHAFDFAREELMRNARARGHDGIILGDHYIAFEPTQIKSATGNRGTYDPRDPRVTY